MYHICEVQLNQNEQVVSGNRLLNLQDTNSYSVLYTNEYCLQDVWIEVHLYEFHPAVKPPAIVIRKKCWNETISNISREKSYHREQMFRIFLTEFVSMFHIFLLITKFILETCYWITSSKALK
jgi:hypothetical protein